MGNVVPFYPEQAAAILERLLAQGDLSRLTHQERAEYYLRVCHSVGLNPYTQPFGYIKFKDGALKLYAFKGCADQLRGLHGISVAESSAKEWRGLFIAKVKVVRPACGRTDQDIGAVSIAGLSGDAFANAVMKAESKAKRRATLGICGLGLLDETEVGTIPGAATVRLHPDNYPQLPAGEEANAKASGTVVPAPKRRLEADRRIDPRYEALIKADERTRSKKPPRYCEAEMAKADAAEWERLNPGPFKPSSFLEGPPEPPAWTEIPDHPGRDRR